MTENSVQDTRQGRILPQEKGFEILGISLALAVVTMVIALLVV